MYFKLTYLISGMSVSRETDLPATVNMNEYTKFTLWNREVEHQGRTDRSLCCDLIVNRDPPDRVNATLAALVENQLLLDTPPQNGLPYASLSGTIVDADGHIKPHFMIPFRLLPKGAKPWLQKLSAEMADLLRSFVTTLRWIQGSSGGHQPFSSVDETWSADGKIWTRVPRDTSVSLVRQKGLDTSSPAFEFACKLIGDDVPEPFAHELVREAGELVKRAPRSALLIAYSALETGIKSYLAHLLPGAKPLIVKVPSPPVITLLQEVIPAILSERGIQMPHLPLQPAAVKYLKKWVAQRNLVAHGLKPSVDRNELASFVTFITDILYLLDASRGHGWALKNLQSEFWSA